MAFNKEGEPSEITPLERSVYCLRQIRGSIFPWIASPNPTIDAQTAIKNAEILGIAAVGYLIDEINNYPLIKPDQNFEQTLAHVEKQYKGYIPLVTSSISGIFAPKDVSIQIETQLNAYKFLARQSDPAQHQWLWDMLKHENNVRLMPGLNIFNERLGIVAPLSSDYLYAALLQRFIQRHTSLPSFQLKPVILSPALDLDALQGDDQEDNVFANSIDEIAIWTGLDVSLRTRRAMSIAVRNMYGDKPVHGYISKANVQ